MHALGEISAGRDARLFPTADGVFACGWADLASPHCDFYAGNVVLGRLRRDGAVPAGWPVGQTAPPFDFAAALDVSLASWESPGVSCPDGLGGFLVFWRVLEGYHPLANNEVRGMRHTMDGPVAGVTPGKPGPLSLRAARFTRGGIGVHVSGVGQERTPRRIESAGA